MVLQLHGSSFSTCTRTVAVVCKEKNIPYELVPVDMKQKAHKAPEFLQNQPFGQIPVAVDDGFILYESRAIARYLIKKYPNQGTPGLIPTDPKEEALFEQAASVEAFNWNPAITAFVFEKVFKPKFGGQTDPVAAKDLLAKAEVKLDVYEVILSKQRYVAGNNFTLVDLQHLAYGTALFGAEPDLLTKRPNLARWWNEISNRPSWLAVKNGA